MSYESAVSGIGALVATVGFAQTAAHQIARQFDAVKATQVVVSPAEAQTRGGSVATSRLPWNAVDRAETLVGIESAVLLAELSLGEDAITAVPIHDPSAAATASPALAAATPELLDVLRGSIVTGRMFDAGHEDRADRVVVLGTRAADRLGINRVDSQPSIFIGDVAYAVIGIYGGLQAKGDLLDAVVMPLSTAQHDRALAAPGTLQARILPGTGPQLAEQLPLALRPDDPEGLEVAAPAASSSLGENVQADVNIVFLVLGAIVLLAGALGIANVTMLNVTAGARHRPAARARLIRSSDRGPVHRRVGRHRPARRTHRLGPGGRRRRRHQGRAAVDAHRGPVGRGGRRRARRDRGTRRGRVPRAPRRPHRAGHRTPRRPLSPTRQSSRLPYQRVAFGLSL